MFRENASSRLCAVLAGLRLVRRGCGLPEYAAASGGAGKDAGESFQALCPLPGLTRPERDCFVECFSGLGRTEAGQECQRLAFYQERFTLFLQQAQEHARPQLELSHKLGFAAGLAAAILCL